MRFILILVALSTYCLAVTLTDVEIEQEWLNFNQKYGKRYRSMKENIERFENFKENLEKIIQHNKRFEQNLVTYKMAVNPFTDMNLKEMEKSYMGLKISKMEQQGFPNIRQLSGPVKNSFRFPTFMDWRDRGAISPVKNQLFCGSCWAFSSTGALEAHYFLKYNKSVILSEQNLVDCVKENFGCRYGWIIPSFDYIRLNGINSASEYPYEAIDRQCRFPWKFNDATCSGYMKIRPGDEHHLLEVIATKGPVAVSISVNSNFQNYAEGIYNDPKCTRLVNHAVLVVGYGTENGQDYWLVKNSWGVRWGEKGYIKMARNKLNQCKIASYALYPLV